MQRQRTAQQRLLLIKQHASSQFKTQRRNHAHHHRRDCLQAGGQPTHARELFNPRSPEEDPEKTGSKRDPGCEEVLPEFLRSPEASLVPDASRPRARRTGQQE
ncbi:MAG UNVERIFIED_CONTAM: hypothetical protein LVR18_38835 [Planctomycetaceae bacterium]